MLQESYIIFLFVAKSTFRTEHMNVILMYVPFCVAFQNVLQERAFRMNNIDSVYKMYDISICR